MPRQHDGPPKPRKQLFYADPEHPGRSRHDGCFAPVKPGRRLNPKKAGYPRTEGPCWVCQRGTEDRTLWLWFFSMLDQLEMVPPALDAVSEAGFALAKDLRCGVLTGSIEREKLESNAAELVGAFRKAWQEGARAAAYPGGQRDFLQVGIAYGLIGLGYVDGRLNERDPRRYLAHPDPTRRPLVNAADIEQVAGRLGYIARVVRRSVKEQREILRTPRGRDENEPLRALVAAYGASPVRLAESAVSFLATPRFSEDRLRYQANLVAGTLRKRKHQSKPLPES